MISFNGTKWAGRTFSRAQFERITSWAVRWADGLNATPKRSIWVRR